MTTLKVHFDGQVLVPHGPLELPLHRVLEVHITSVEPASSKDKPLLKLARALEALPANPDWPADGAAQHEHYLYGLPKRP